MIHINNIKKTYIPPTVDIVEIDDECILDISAGGQHQGSGNGEVGGGDPWQNDAKFTLGVNFSAYFSNDFDEEEYLEEENDNQNYSW